MKNTRILVTGGAGFIGSHLVDRLTEMDNEVIVFDSLISGNLENIKDALSSGKCSFIKGDIRFDADLEKIPGDIEYIFHMAADPDVKTSVSRPVESFDFNVNGTLKMLEFARKNDVKGFIFASSGGTLYGDADHFPIDEDTVLRPISPYGASKAAGEMYISAYANVYGFKAVSGRYANIFGERSTHGVSFDFYMKLKKNPRELTILGNGLQKKSYLHVSDCVEATLLIADNLERQKKAYEYYNIGSEEWRTVNEIAELIERLMGLENVEHKYTGGQRGWAGDVSKILLSIDKLKGLGWSPRLSFEEGMKRYIEWLKGNFP